MTLEHTLHAQFDQLSWCLQPTDALNEYEFVPFKKNALTFKVMDETGQGRRENGKLFVNFESSDSERLPLPNPSYLRLHAVCCKVAHLSGAAAYLDDMEEERDNHPQGDPVPAHLLTHLLTLVEMQA